MAAFEEQGAAASRRVRDALGGIQHCYHRLLWKDLYRLFCDILGNAVLLTNMGEFHISVITRPAICSDLLSIDAGGTKNHAERGKERDMQTRRRLRFSLRRYGGRKRKAVT